MHAYILAHAQELPDGRYSGLHDAATIIRAKFIGMPGTKLELLNILLDLHWRDFECLIERLYHEMGYQTQLTPPQKDKGRDIIATRKEPTRQEYLLIECKLYSEEPVGFEIVQRLLGAVSGDKATKGVIVTTSHFTKPAHQNHQVLSFLPSSPLPVFLCDICDKRATTKGRGVLSRSVFNGRHLESFKRFIQRVSRYWLLFNPISLLRVFFRHLFRFLFYSILVSHTSAIAHMGGL